MLYMALLAMLAGFAVASADTAGGVPADRALSALLDGNRRYTAARPRHPHQQQAHRLRVAKGQAPFAVIVSCADSRVPPEIVFDQGLGDLFVIRVAGNIIDDAILASVEYAVEHLGARLIMVLGHERCGAVEATLKRVKEHGHLGVLLTAISPAVESVKSRSGDALDQAVRANIRRVTRQLRASEPILAPMVKAGKVKVAGGRYDLETGRVELVR